MFFERRHHVDSSIPTFTLVWDGRVIVWGEEFRLPLDPYIDESARAQTQETLRALGERVRGVHTPPLTPGLWLNADCQTAWRLARVLLRVVPPRERHSFTWLVASPPHGRELEMRASLVPLADKRSDLRLSLRQGASGSVEIDVDGRTFRFPPGCLPTDRTPIPVLEEGNAVWTTIERALEARPDARTAILKTGTEADSVPLAYVITVFDLLVGRGVLGVDLPDEGARFEFVAPPSSLDEQHPKPRPAGELIPWWVGVLTVVGMVLAFQVTMRRAN